jgi:hypothetical protein
MIFPPSALASGPGMAWNSIAFMPTWPKVKVGKQNPGIENSSVPDKMDF